MLERHPGAAASTEATATPADTPANTQSDGSPPKRIKVKLPNPDPDPEVVRHILFGGPEAVQLTIHELHRKRYAEPNDWSRLLPTGRKNEVMAILTKRVPLD